jgi:hypothetical protein
LAATWVGDGTESGSPLQAVRNPAARRVPTAVSPNARVARWMERRRVMVGLRE